MRFDFFEGGRIDERALLHAGLQSCTHLELGCAGRELRDERLIDFFMREEAVRANAGLAGIAVLGSQRAFDRGIDIRILKDDERGIAAKLQGELL